MGPGGYNITRPRGPAGPKGLVTSSILLGGPAGPRKELVVTTSTKGPCGP